MVTQNKSNGDRLSFTVEDFLNYLSGKAPEAKRKMMLKAFKQHPYYLDILDGLEMLYEKYGDRTLDILDNLDLNYSLSEKIPEVVEELNSVYEKFSDESEIKKQITTYRPINKDDDFGLLVFPSQKDISEIKENVIEIKKEMEVYEIMLSDVKKKVKEEVRDEIRIELKQQVEYTETLLIRAIRAFRALDIIMPEKKGGSDIESIAQDSSVIKLKKDKEDLGGLIRAGTTAFTHNVTIPFNSVTDKLKSFVSSIL